MNWLEYRQEVSTGTIEVLIRITILDNYNIDNVDAIELANSITTNSRGLLDCRAMINSVGYDGEAELVLAGWRPATADELVQIEYQMREEGIAEELMQQSAEQFNRRGEQLKARGIRVARYEED